MLVEQCGRSGIKNVIVITAGFAEAGHIGANLERKMLEIARSYNVRILGPNCVGLLVPGQRLNASFAHTDARPGSLAFVSQSGALVTAMLDWAAARGIGFSHFVSLGERADVDFGDLLDYLGSDAHTRAVLLYIESIDNPRKFMSAARAAARNKPVIVVKAGRSAQGQKAAASHTGALAGNDKIYEDVLRQSGVIRARSLRDIVDGGHDFLRLL